MKRLLAIILILVCIASCAYSLEIQKDQNIVISYNACGSTFGAENIDLQNSTRSGDVIIFPMDGYEVRFIIKDNSITGGGLLLKDESAAGKFIIGCMTMISILGDMDYEAFGTMLFQYGEIRSGKDEAMLGMIGIDGFNMQPGPEGFICMFVYSNLDGKELF